MYPYANRRNLIFVVQGHAQQHVPRSIDVKICTVLEEHPSQLHGKKAFPHFSREINPCWVSKSSDS